MKKFITKVLIATLFFFGLSSQVAEAATVTSSFTIQEYSYDDSGMTEDLEIQHPSKVICASPYSCSIPVKYRFVDAFSSIGEFVYLKDSYGHQGSLYASDTSGSWVSAKVTIYNLNATSDVKLNWEVSLVLDTLVSSDSNSITVKNTPAPIGYAMPTVWPENTTSYSWWTPKIRDIFPFMYISMSTDLTANAKCQKVHVAVAPLDIFNGYSASSKGDYSFTLTMQNVNGVQVSKTTLSGDSWSSEDDTEFDAEFCGVKDKKTKVTKFKANLAYSMVYEGATYSGTTSTPVVFTGVNKYKKINCLKGTKVKVVNAFKPKCPAGYKKTNLKVVGGKLAATSITCAKGLQLKKVTGVLPSCPAGWKRK